MSYGFFIGVIIGAFLGYLIAALVVVPWMQRRGWL